MSKTTPMSPPGGIKSLLQKFDSGDAFSHTNHSSQRDYELELLRHSGLVSKASSYLESLLEEERELLEREGIGSLIRELLKRKKLEDGQNGKQKESVLIQMERERRVTSKMISAVSCYSYLSCSCQELLVGEIIYKHGRGFNQRLEVQEEKAALVKRGLEQDTVLARRERENEETNNLISLLRSDLDRIGNERENLQQTNNHLLQVLSQAVKSVIATEDTINKKLSHLEGRRKSSPSEEAQDGHRGVQEGAVGGGDVNDVGPNTSILSNMSDEGLELSQQLAESMFAGPDLDSDGEELITNANNRLQASIDSLLERMTGLSGIEEPIQTSRSELQQTSPTDEADSHLRAETERLEERLEEESTERQRLTAELDRTQGHAQTDDLEQSLQASEQKQLQVIMDLETARNAKIAAEAECQKLRQQQNQLIEKLDGKKEGGSFVKYLPMEWGGE
ncbi:putative A-kinase anchor protein 9 isoform X6 [Apostichopus japonicus]|uniref:Putative A-kinase anchor protein 9 isoform X6 n=1 Tax=Stichopus japonicus TaxID=307972 RepID=A0A2G8JSA3_STIJA|nr:putative A-kinase anchor protein 9 isoform X6 [Apostichopus japonicus]